MFSSTNSPSGCSQTKGRFALHIRSFHFPFNENASTQFSIPATSFGSLLLQELYKSGENGTPLLQVKTCSCSRSFNPTSNQNT